MGAGGSGAPVIRPVAELYVRGTDLPRARPSRPPTKGPSQPRTGPGGPGAGLGPELRGSLQVALVEKVVDAMPGLNSCGLRRLGHHGRLRGAPAGQGAGLGTAVFAAEPVITRCAGPPFVRAGLDRPPSG